MLSKVIALLEGRGWFDPSRPYDKTVYLTHGAAQTLLLSRDGQAECFVKFSDCASLVQEAKRCEAAALRFPGMAPAFIGHARVGSLEVLATQAVAFRAMNAGLMRSARHMGVVQAGLEEYFRRMREGGTSGASGNWVAAYRAYFDALPWRQPAHEALDELLDLLKPLPRMDQHGDFVVNNLGIGQQGRLAVFDWEDLGAVDIPGLDLFTLEVSAHEASASGGVDRPALSGCVHLLDIERLCVAMGLPLDVYDRLRPAYAFVFRFLKRNYGPEVRGRVDRLLHRLSAVAAAA